MRKAKDYILLYLKGLSMGMADVVPGISGSTVAFIFGIYEELLYSIRAIDREAFQLLKKFRIAELWKKINGNFLVTVLAGIISSILFGIKFISWLLVQYTVPFLAFCFSLILVAAPLMLREIKEWNAATVVSLLAGIAIAWVITLITPLHAPNALWFVFIAGIITICAMTLPGISGPFILVLIGEYQFITNAIVERNVIVIAIFTLGCLAGLAFFTRALTRMLERYHGITVALLIGFMLGSLNKVWPWREVLEYATNRKGEQISAFDKSILPWDYLSKTGKDPLIFQAIFMMALGIFLVVLIEKVAERLKTKH